MLYLILAFKVFGEFKTGFIIAFQAEFYYFKL